MRRVNINADCSNYRVGSGHLDDALDRDSFCQWDSPQKSVKGNRDEKVLREQLSYVQFDEEEYQNDWSYYWPLLKSIVF